ncbi:NERD domain-containing protein [Alkalihalobacillus sp. BA299]|uniref:NERD domain-containing protein n=1 Tax=Alkalihalobacillus sp. BA299 TaxID=2815938 RepID=UPI001ADAC71E|nr:NERD domain-containing protein [Alkalihalobacillus sp. BA299]
MAHLIKLEDYISRYQFDMQRYPTQFTRMKKERWYYLKNEWEHLNVSVSMDEKEGENSVSHGEQSNTVMSTVKKLKGWRLFQKRKTTEDKEAASSAEEEKDRITLKANSLDDLKQLFLDDIFGSQLMWASSSLLERSYLNPKYKYDEHLRFFAQKMPDNYFLMYLPVFWMKQAPIDMDIILITPSEVHCITTLEGSEHSIFQASSERFWIEQVKKSERKRLSPIVSLNRMASIISDIMKENHCEFPIKKTVLSKDCFIDHNAQGLKVELIDKRSFSQWQHKMKKHPSPIKSHQLKVAKMLLDHCHTSAHVRQEIEDTKENDNE